MSVLISVKVQTVTPEELDALADQVPVGIITDDMTLRDKAWAIYQYVNHHLTYTGISDKTDWMKEAYNGINKAVGDCHTYYSISNLLLNRVGIENLSVERLTKPGDSRHYWHMINLARAGTISTPASTTRPMSRS